MSVIVRCQHTGIEFEANSKRSKNHPMVACFLNEASRDKHHRGAYAKAKEILADAVSQYADIDEIVTQAAAVYSAWLDSGDSGIVVRTWKQKVAASKAAEIRAARAKETPELMDIFGANAYFDEYGE